MKSKLLAIIAITGGLSLTMIGTASAAPLGHPKHHPKPKPVTQVTGKQLAKALLPGSAFGIGDTATGLVTSGGKLVSSGGSISSYPCGDILFGVPLIGQSAVALNTIESDGALVGSQSISQFKSNATAWWYLGQLKGKYNACPTFSTGAGSSAQTGPISLSIDLQNVASTKVGKNSAFTVTQVVEVSDSFGDSTESLNTTVVQSGRNVYAIWEMNEGNTPVPNALLNKLISRTRALYKG
ncbi:MAG TPA: hypothetical protein VGG16_15725 [Streptosporangiaceae bacterium]